MDLLGMGANLVGRFENCSSYRYSYIFTFEKNHDEETTHRWMIRNWTLSIYIALAYLMVIFSLKKYMRDKAPLNVRVYLVTWNALLAAFSVTAAIRTLPEFVYHLKEFGLHHSVCDSYFYYSHPITAFWGFAFVTSKVPELLDTVFVVLRKQNLTVLHWSHHALTVVASWLVYTEQVAIARWFFVMNFSVHSVMYSYFALRALKIKLPRKLALFITCSQIAQMFVGFAVSSYAFYFYAGGYSCGIGQTSAIVAQSVYCYYFFLFFNFFLKSYVLPRVKSDKTD